MAPSSPPILAYNFKHKTLKDLFKIEVILQPRILSSGIIPVYQKEGNWLFLVLRCFNYWDFPKGEVDGKEDLLSAAKRELNEETSLRECQILFDKSFIETEPYAKNKVARYYLGKVNTQEVILLPNPEDGIVEHHEYRWLRYSDARALLNPRLEKVLDWAHHQLEKK